MLCHNYCRKNSEPAEAPALDWSQPTGFGEEPVKRRYHRRGFLSRAAMTVGGALVMTVGKPGQALACENCELGCQPTFRRICYGNCSCSTSTICWKSYNGNYCDCCSGRCFGSGCCSVRTQRVKFTIGNNGCCFCELNTCLP